MLNMDQLAPRVVHQASSTVEDVLSLLSAGDDPLKASHDYLQAFPCQAAESSFFILAVSVLKHKDVPADIKELTEGLVSKLSELLV